MPKLTYTFDLQGFDVEKHRAVLITSSLGDSIRFRKTAQTFVDQRIFCTSRISPLLDQTDRFEVLSELERLLGSEQAGVLLSHLLEV